MSRVLSTIYITPAMFAPIAKYVADEFGAPVLVLGVDHRGRRMAEHFGKALYYCGIPYVSYILRQNGYEEGFKRIIGIVEKPADKNSPIIPASSLSTLRTAACVTVDDFIDSFETGAGVDFYTLEQRQNLGYEGVLLNIVLYDLLGGVAHVSRDIRDPRRFVIGSRQKLLRRLRDLGPKKYREFQRSGKLDFIADATPLNDDLCAENSLEDKGHEEGFGAYLSRLAVSLGLKSLPSDSDEPNRRREPDAFLDELFRSGVEDARK